MDKIFAIYDSKAQAYLQPFFARTNGLAVRMFETAAKEEGNNFNKHAADYTLFEIGEWDEHKGEVEALNHFNNLGTALEYKSHEEGEAHPRELNESVPTRENGNMGPNVRPITGGE